MQTIIRKLKLCELSGIADADTIALSEWIDKTFMYLSVNSTSDAFKRYFNQQDKQLFVVFLSSNTIYFEYEIWETLTNKYITNNADDISILLSYIMLRCCNLKGYKCIKLR